MCTSLLDKGLISVSNYQFSAVRDSLEREKPKNLHPLDHAILKKVLASEQQANAIQAYIVPYLNQIEVDLRISRLLVSSRKDSTARKLSSVILVGIVLVGTVRILIDVARFHPGVPLLLLCSTLFIITLFLHFERLHLSHAGKRVLAREKAKYLADQKSHVKIDRALGVALYGIDTLRRSPLRDLYSTLKSPAGDSDYVVYCGGG